MEPLGSIDQIVVMPNNVKVTTPDDPLDQPDDVSRNDGPASDTAIPLWAISTQIHGIMKFKESDWQANQLIDQNPQDDKVRVFCFRWGINIGIIAVLALILLIVYVCWTASRSPVVHVAFVPTDCSDLFHREGESFNGIYTISPPDMDSVHVHCDMSTDGGGWTVFQRRINHGLMFWNKSWNEYKHGFNNSMDRDYWLGLDRLHILSNKDENVTLRIDIWGDRCILEPVNNITSRNCTQTENGYWFGEWQFQVSNESDGYMLYLPRRIAGNLTTEDNNADSFQSNSDQMMFTTVDEDNDMHPSVNCAAQSKLGGWWHSNCTSSSLNGDYNMNEFGESGFRWRHKQTDGTFTWIYPLLSEMKLRKMNAVSPSMLQVIPVLNE